MDNARDKRAVLRSALAGTGAREWAVEGRRGLGVGGGERAWKGGGGWGWGERELQGRGGWS